MNMRDFPPPPERRSPPFAAGDAETTSRRRQPNVTPQLALGLFILGLGVLLMLDRLGVVDAGRTMRLWPAALVALGAAMWMRGHAPARFWGSIWIFLGGWLLLNTLGIVRIGFWELFWPVVLVLVGLKLVMHTSRQMSSTASGTNLFAMMGECKRTSGEAPFRDGQMTAIMGGCRLDLRQARVPAGEDATLEVFALMGGLELWVPAGWTVLMDDVVPVLGGVDDKRLPPVPAPPGSEAEPAPRLRIRGHVVMGGLVIRN